MFQKIHSKINSYPKLFTTFDEHPVAVRVLSLRKNIVDKNIQMYNRNETYIIVGILISIHIICPHIWMQVLVTHSDGSFLAC